MSTMPVHVLYWALGLIEGFIPPSHPHYAMGMKYVKRYATCDPMEVKKNKVLQESCEKDFEQYKANNLCG